MSREKHMNLYTIFKRAQLLERFGALQRRRFPAHEIKKRFAAKTVNALMAQIFYWNRAIAGKGDRVAREIERVAVEIDNHFHLMWRRCLSCVFKRMRRGHDVDLGI